MIGHFLLTLSPEEEGRLLTGKLTPRLNDMHEVGGPGCLLQAVDDRSLRDPFSRVRRDSHHQLGATVRHMAIRGRLSSESGWKDNLRHSILHWSVGHRFDALCERFGVERVGRVIRTRVLSNQARRALSQHGVSLVS